MEKVFCAIYCLLPAWIMACWCVYMTEIITIMGSIVVDAFIKPRSWQQYVPWFWMRMDRWPTALHLCTCNAIWFMGDFILTRSWLVVDARGPMTSCSASVSAPSVNHAPFVGFLAPDGKLCLLVAPFVCFGSPALSFGGAPLFSFVRLCVMLLLNWSVELLCPDSYWVIRN